MQNKVAAALRISLLLILLSVLHAFGSVLGSLWLLSDVLLVLGAVSAYNLGTKKEARDLLLKQFDNVIDIDGLAKSVLTLINQFLSDKNENGTPDVLENDADK